MKLRLLALAASLTAITLVPGVSRAQIGIYVTPVFTRVSNSQVDNGTFSFLGPNTTSRIFSGGGVGVFDDFKHSGALDLGGDIRWTIQQGNTAHLNQFLFGPRLAFRPTRFPARPYVEVVGGLGETTAETNPQPQNRFGFGFLGGVDYKLSKHIDFRVIEVGYGNLQTISTQSHTNVPPLPPSSMLINFSSGIVFRLPQHLVP